MLHLPQKNKEKMKKRIALSRSDSSYLRRKEREISTAALATLFTAAGAEYSASDGTYTLNGVSGITAEEMSRIYNCKENIYRLSQAGTYKGTDTRTIIPANGDGSTLELNGKETFAGSCIEVIKLGKTQVIDDCYQGLMPKAQALKGTFNGCYALHTIYPINVAGITDASDDTFAGCTALQEIRLNSLQSDIDLSQAAGITLKSIKYIADNCDNSSTITINIHPATYASLGGRGTQKKEWEAVRENAAGKNIAFATTCLVAYVHKSTININQGTVQGATLSIAGSDAAVDNATIVFS